MKPKSQPERMCAACRTNRNKRELIRVVRLALPKDAPKDTVPALVIDDKGKLNGRGVYVCADVGCIKKLRKIRAVERMLKVQVPETLWEELQCRITTTTNS
ncbi:MAG: YlxR family protein [Oscillospiraceae bacterium]|nr:YlxR family protein [Oscillospiraceae bacterium]